MLWKRPHLPLCDGAVWLENYDAILRNWLGCVTGEESGLLWEDLFALQNAVEWRAVTARSPEERAQVHSMSYLLNTCKGVSNLELIEEGARWIQQGSEQEERRGAAGVKALFSMLATTTPGRAEELVKQGLNERIGMTAFCKVRERFG